MDTSQMNGKPEGAPDTPPHTPIMESMTRLVKIPVVEKTLTAASDVYEKVKESSSALNWTLSTAESTVNKAVETAMPLTAKLEKPLKTVDSLLCSSLDYVEAKVPAVKLPPQEFLDTTKTMVVEKAAAVKEYGGQKLRSMSLDRQSAAMLAQNCKDLASTGMVKAKSVAQKLIAPKEEEEEAVEEAVSQKGQQGAQQQKPAAGEDKAVPAAMQYDGTGDDSKTPYVLRY
ncbi:lipid storage droplets surface-binding protein 2-like isoform X2 [Ischnura elegans]|uniref:lipid storage droplets surface-binding protein 2-like isoform X2 n=1 Tax=Ischnura elegans TaxID=197161 RepID=UPI001ED895A5|nr:lipid storage droplets surface-binding protein 2-like isoform X2 [Ischnura elegans]